jgi:hypothetical protein
MQYPPHTSSVYVFREPCIYKKKQLIKIYFDEYMEYIKLYHDMMRVFPAYA